MNDQLNYDIQSSILEKSWKDQFSNLGSLDKIDVIEFKTIGMDQSKLLYFGVILDAISCYLYLGTSHKDVSSIHEFWSAYNYLFNIRSYNEDSWKDNREVPYTYKGDGKKIEEVIQLTDTELKDMCFDIHYNKSDFNKVMSIETFLHWLKAKRENIVIENYDSIMSFINKASININCKSSTDRKNNMKYLVDPGKQEEFFMELFNA